MCPVVHITSILLQASTRYPYRSMLGMTTDHILTYLNGLYKRSTFLASCFSNRAYATPTISSHARGESGGQPKRHRVNFALRIRERRLLPTLFTLGVVN